MRAFLIVLSVIYVMSLSIAQNGRSTLDACGGEHFGDFSQLAHAGISDASPAGLDYDGEEAKLFEARQTAKKGETFRFGACK
ncbi:MAG: hypothetical protein ACX939_02020 [Hyphococcus sp.]